MATSRRRFIQTIAAFGLAASSHARLGYSFEAQPYQSNLLPGQQERIIFLGDSITQGGNYVAYLESLIRLRHPKSHIEIYNHGISSETISGTSELDHNPRRPWAHERFTRDVTDWKPSVVLSCFGMNDGNYHPFDQDRFEKYRNGINRLIERVHQEAHCNRLVISTPPPFDAYQRKNNDPEATDYGYRYPALNYDDTLHRYAEWLLTLRQNGQPVVDLHSRLNRHLAQRRHGKVSYTMMPDAVHPNSTGHAVMAIVMAEGLGLTGPRDSAVVDFKQNSGHAKHGEVEISVNGPETFIRWHVPPAWCFGPDVDQESLNLEQVNSKFNRLHLKINAPVEKTSGYRLVMSQGENAPDVVRDLSAQELAEGVLIDPPNRSDAPDRIAGEAFAAAVMKHRQAASAAWRSRAMKLTRDDPKRGPLREELEAESNAADQLSQEATKVAGPVVIKLVRNA